ncbi:MAG: DinB family protein [Chitinophagales bacterium]
MKEHLSTVLENSKTYTFAVANLMPEQDYEFKPNNEIWNFRELLHHIAYGIEWWQDNYIKDKKTEWNQPPAKSNKKEVIAYLNTAYASLKDTISKGKLSSDAVKGFNATIDHITHHRGQATIYLRCRGITPPAYVY